MSISRRKFNQAAVAAGASLALGRQAALAADISLIRSAIPSTGQRIPIVGMGTNRYGVGADKDLRAPLSAALRTFSEMGGAVIDTAPGYGSSETVLGELMHELGIRDDLFLATKVDVEGSDACAERMQASFDRLQVTTVDLMQVHNLTGWRDALPVAKEWKQDGRILTIGITTSRERQYELMETVMQQFSLDFIQVNYSLANQRTSADRLIPLAAEKGIAVIVNRPFGGGRAFRKLANASIPEWATEIGAFSWAQFLLKYVLSHPSVTCAIPGMTKQHHVVDNLAAATGDMPSARQRREMETFFDNL